MPTLGALRIMGLEALLAGEDTSQAKSTDGAACKLFLAFPVLLYGSTAEDAALREWSRHDPTCSLHRALRERELYTAPKYVKEGAERRVVTTKPKICRLLSSLYVFGDGDKALKLDSWRFVKKMSDFVPLERLREQQSQIVAALRRVETDHRWDGLVACWRSAMAEAEVCQHKLIA